MPEGCCELHQTFVPRSNLQRIFLCHLFRSICRHLVPMQVLSTMGQRADLRDPMIRPCPTRRSSHSSRPSTGPQLQCNKLILTCRVSSYPKLTLDDSDEKGRNTKNTNPDTYFRPNKDFYDRITLTQSYLPQQRLCSAASSNRQNWECTWFFLGHL